MTTYQAKAKKNDGIVVAADVFGFRELQQLLQAIREVPGISGIKLGFSLAILGLPRAVHLVREYLGDDVDIIYDHQKAGTDIPRMGELFARQLQEAGVDSVILFPFAGPETQESWTLACKQCGLSVLTGGVMPHGQFLAGEGGYIADDAVLRIYRMAVQLGCRRFVVPGTKVEWVSRIRQELESSLVEGEFSLYAPGFITQGGDITECGRAAGSRFYPIVGSAIYEQLNREEQEWAARRIVGKFMRSLQFEGASHG